MMHEYHFQLVIELIKASTAIIPAVIWFVRTR